MLDLLLQEGVRAQIPPVEELPLPGVFLDIECRNIYEAFCALYAGASRPPDFQTLKSRLGAHERTVARLAKIMLEREVASGRIGLLESLDKLTDRWRRQRIKELHGEINEAQRKGDHALRDRLVFEETRLSRSLHRGSRQGANHGPRLSPFCVLIPVGVRRRVKNWRFPVQRPSRREVQLGQAADRAGQGEGLPPLRRDLRDAAGGGGEPPRRIG